MGAIILIVDDNPRLRALIRRIVTQACLQVVERRRTARKRSDLSICSGRISS